MEYSIFGIIDPNGKNHLPISGEDSHSEIADRLNLLKRYGHDTTTDLIKRNYIRWVSAIIYSPKELSFETFSPLSAKQITTIIDIVKHLGKMDIYLLDYREIPTSYKSTITIESSNSKIFVSKLNTIIPKKLSLKSKTFKDITESFLINEVSPEGMVSLQRMGMQDDHEGALARSNWEKITKTKWVAPGTNSLHSLPKPEPKKPEETKEKLKGFGFEYQSTKKAAGKVFEIYDYKGKNPKLINYILEIELHYMTEYLWWDLYHYQENHKLDVAQGETFQQLATTLRAIINSV